MKIWGNLFPATFQLIAALNTLNWPSLLLVFESELVDYFWKIRVCLFALKSGQTECFLGKRDSLRVDERVPSDFVLRQNSGLTCRTFCRFWPTEEEEEDVPLTHSNDMAKRVRRRSGSRTHFSRTGSQRRFTASGIIVTSVRRLSAPGSVFPGGFGTLDSGGEREPPRPLLKLSSGAPETDEQPEGTDGRGGWEPGTCQWRLTRPMREQCSAGGAEPRPIAGREEAGGRWRTRILHL